MIKIRNKEIAISILALILLVMAVLFGFAGVKVIGSAILLFFLPFYLILDSFELELEEKIIFSFFIGIGIFSSFVYYLGIVFDSIKTAVVITFVLLILVGIILKKLKKKQVIDTSH